MKNILSAVIAVFCVEAAAGADDAPLPTPLQRAASTKSAPLPKEKVKCRSHNNLGIAETLPDGRVKVPQGFSTGAVAGARHSSQHDGKRQCQPHGDASPHPQTQIVIEPDRAAEGMRTIRLDPAPLKSAMSRHHSACYPFEPDRYDISIFLGNPDRVDADKVAASLALSIPAKEWPAGQLELSTVRPPGRVGNRWIFVVRASAEGHRYESPQIRCALTERSTKRSR